MVRGARLESGRSWVHRLDRGSSCGVLVRRARLESGRSWVQWLACSPRVDRS